MVPGEGAGGAPGCSGAPASTLAHPAAIPLRNTTFAFLIFHKRENLLPISLVKEILNVSLS